ncbi:MAG: hypothetical protein DRO36_07245, partial [Candidatus Hecatellales archaeon]
MTRKIFIIAVLILLNAKFSIAHEDRGFQYGGESGYPANGGTYTAEIIAWSYDEEGMPREDTFNFTVDGGKVSIVPNPLTITGTGRATVIISTIKNTPQTVTISEGGSSYKVYIFKPKIIGFSIPETYARHPNCDIKKHQSTCQVEIEPKEAGNQALTFKIIGNKYGAEIDEGTGIITPGITQSGQIKARVEVKDYPNCYDEKTFLIKARPMEVKSSFVIPYIPYGGQWTHTFQSTGESLLGEMITEEVFQGNDPFNLNHHVSKGTYNWSLNSSGTMTNSDTYWIHPIFINLNSFDKFPQIETVIQTYHWLCPLSGEWRQITTSRDINFELSVSERHGIATVMMYTQYYAAGEPLIFDYVGFSKIFDVRLFPRSIKANGFSRAIVRVKIIPKNRKIHWSIEGNDLGCSIRQIKNNLAIVTAGTQAGEITIRATDSLYLSNYK